MNRRPLAFLILAFALVLAPLGLCLGHGAAALPAQSTSPAGHGAHGTSSDSADHRRHGDEKEAHFCAECRPDSFVKASAPSAFGLVSVAPVGTLLPPTPKMVEPAMGRPVFAHERSPPP